MQLAQHEQLLNEHEHAPNNWHLLTSEAQKFSLHPVARYTRQSAPNVARATSNHHLIVLVDDVVLIYLWKIKNNKNNYD